MYSPRIQKIIEKFSKFPTVGPKTAARFAFYLIKCSQEEIKELTELIKELKNKTALCQLCFYSFEPKTEDEKICPICSNPQRNKKIICLVEKEMDIEAIEKVGKYKGLYFVLGGLISGLKKKEEKLEERLEKLKERTKKEGVEEIIIALNPTTEGQRTILWLQRSLEPLTNNESNQKIKITQLGRGLPVGGELEYADEETISSALESRK